MKSNSSAWTIVIILISTFVGVSCSHMNQPGRYWLVENDQRWVVLMFGVKEKSHVIWPMLSSRCGGPIIQSNCVMFCALNMNDQMRILASFDGGIASDVTSMIGAEPSGGWRIDEIERSPSGCIVRLAGVRGDERYINISWDELMNAAKTVRLKGVRDEILGVKYFRSF